MRKILLLLLGLVTLNLFAQEKKVIYCDAVLVNKVFAEKFPDRKKDPQELEKFIEAKKAELQIANSKYKEQSFTSMDTISKLINCLNFIPQKSKDYITSINVRIIEIKEKEAKLKLLESHVNNLKKKRPEKILAEEKVELNDLLSYNNLLNLIKSESTNKEIEINYSNLDFNKILLNVLSERSKLEEELNRISARKNSIIGAGGKQKGTEDTPLNFWIEMKDYESICIINKLFIDDESKLPIPKALSYGFLLSSEDYNSLTAKLVALKSSDVLSCMQIKEESISNIEDDIQSAEDELNLLNNVENSNQRFRMFSTIAVSVLLAIIMIAFFGGILFKANSAVRSKLIGESGLQFITIFVIIIAVILFGVLNILQGSELAAILSAIAGYILGKTAPPKTEKVLELELKMLELEEKKAEREWAAKRKETTENSSENQSQDQGEEKPVVEGQEPDKAEGSDEGNANDSSADQDAKEPEK